MKKHYLVVTALLSFLMSISPSLGMDEILSTPEHCFEDLPDYPFEPHYLEVEPSLKMHYLDEGSQSGPVVLLLHGEPYWSYGFRKMIPKLAEMGFRVIAPDMIGFGKSSKFSDPKAYSYTRQCKWVDTLIEDLDLQNIHVFAHDWGAMVMLRLIAENPQRYEKVAISYGYLFTGLTEMPESFLQWKKFAFQDTGFNPGIVMNWGTHREVSLETIAAYNAPFPTEEYLSAVRIFPSLIPTEQDDPEALKNVVSSQKLTRLKIPFLTIWGNHPDDLWTGLDSDLRKLVPGSKGQSHQILESGHFITEDQPEALTQILLNFFLRG